MERLPEQLDARGFLALGSGDPAAGGLRGTVVTVIAWFGSPAVLA
jgi:hypothetical protein